jgi:hypothetical protein
MLKIQNKTNENYLAKVAVINNLRKHKNADRLQITTIDGNNVIVGIDIKEGDKGIFFPLESQISDWFLKENNLYDDKTLNKDQEKKGYISHKGRVRALRLKKEMSEGLWLPISSLYSSFEDIYEGDLKDGTYFDTVLDKLLVKKYVIEVKERKSGGLKNQVKQEKKFSKIIDSQFRFHESTAQLGKNIYKVNPDDIIVITQKLHGTSVVLSNILCKKQLTWKDKLAKFFGINVVEEFYDNVYSSRTVIKNKYEDTTNPNSYYKTDVWGEVNNEYKEFIEKGITLYGEIVGFESSGSFIQKGYVYGCEQKQHKFYVYRITSTNVDGRVIEFSWQQIKDYCNRYSISHVPEYYYGIAYNLFNLNKEHHWNDNFFNKLKETYLEKTLPEKTPDEGIVLRIEKGLNLEYYKLKSFTFLEKETKQLDKGEVDLESMN